MRSPLRSLAVHTLLGVSFAALALAPTRPAAAEGMQGHMYVTEEAVRLVKTPALKALLDSERDGYLIGSIFPDSGYWAQHEYGEESHWEPFVEGYLSWIREHYAPPFNQGEAARHVAVLMGIASHVMSDQVFDILFLDKVGEVSGDSAKSQLDTHIDFFLVSDRNRRINPNDVSDADVLSGIMRDRLGLDAPAATIRDGIGRAKIGIGGVITGTNAIVVGGMRLTNGWAYDNYLGESVAGGYPHNARVVAGYFEALWQRLHGRVDWQRTIAGSHPVAHAREHSVNHGSLDSFVTLFAGDPLRASSLGEGRFALLNSAREPVATHLRSRRDGHQEATTLQLRPAQDLAYNSWYRVVLRPGIETVRGDVLDRELGFWFKTVCPPAPEACPTVPEPVDERDEPADAGVDAGGEPEDDAGESPVEDAGTVPADGGAGRADAGPLDGGQPDSADASYPVDAATPARDAASEADASAAPGDAGAYGPERDAATSAGSDAGPDTEVDIDPVMPGEGGEDGCSCSTPGSVRTSPFRALPTALFMLLLFVPFRRREKR